MIRNCNTKTLLCLKTGTSLSLGTIITEWDEGAAICKQMLESFAVVDELTTRLANIAAFFGFDGWLINIENKIDVSY